MTNRTPDVTALLDGATLWRDELRSLREIMLGTGMDEAVKWKSPVYSHAGGNVAILQAFKDGPAVGFFKGALLTDPNGILHTHGENSHGSRSIWFIGGTGIAQTEPTLRAYLAEAMEIEASGAQIDYKRDEDLVLVPEIVAALAADPVLKAAFDGLTRGRQRGYNLVIGGLKQTTSRIARFDGFRDRILKGKGPQDCICGLSKRLPRCDGSHKSLTGAA
jgi:uncharacterized protein YdeI (YjbR/CyaY-like superfamily)